MVTALGDFQLWGASSGLDTAYDGNCLVNAFLLGLVWPDTDKISTRRFSGVRRMPVCVCSARKLGREWRRRRDKWLR